MNRDTEIVELKKQISKLQDDVEKLKADSHKPVNLLPIIQDEVRRQRR